VVRSEFDPVTKEGEHVAGVRGDQIRWRLNIFREKVSGRLDCISWLELWRLLPKSSLRWPPERFAVAQSGGETRPYRTPLGRIVGPSSEQAALGGTVLEVLSGAYDYGPTSVRGGDVVIDLGTHLGTFTQFALRRGARHVVCVEANPVNADCLRQTFADQIRDGRVTIVQSPVWSDHRTVRFEGQSLTGHIADSGQEMTTTTIDSIVETLGLDKVDFIKADIEGAERHALVGANGTLARLRPRLAFCVYHYPDDPEVIQQIVEKHGYRFHFEGSGRYIYCW
jgi:FkbM family methyltransferase